MDYRTTNNILMFMIKAVIFDLDGVIIDSEFLSVQAAEMSFSQIGIRLTEEDKKIIIGRNADDYYNILGRKYKKLDHGKIYKQHLLNYDLSYREPPIFQDILKLISYLHANKMPLALATSSRKESLARKLNGRVDLKIFDVIITFEDCKRRKPAPDVYLIVSQKLDIAPANCLVFEDTDIGVEAAKNAGMKCVALSNDYTRDQDFSKADLIIAHEGIDWEGYLR